jgi:hypothetical protein
MAKKKKKAAAEKKKKKLLSLNFQRLPNDAHIRLFRIVLEKVKAAEPFVKNSIGSTLINLLEALVGKEDALMRWVGLTVLTEQIAEAGRRLDRAFTGFAAYVRAAVYNPLHAIAEAAKRLKAMLKNFGKVISKSYDEEAGDIKTVLENLDGPYAADVTALGIGGMKDALQATYDEFEALLKEREDAGKQKPEDTFPEVRRELEDAFHQIAEKVNAGAALELSQGFGLLIDNLNPVLERFRIEFHYVRYDIKHAQPAPIPDEPFTGEQRTPLPSSVLLHKRDGTEVRLTFGTDYTLTYKNNIEVGNAYCILHGKGKYKGTKSVSFIIRYGAIEQNEQWNAEIEEAAATAKAAPVEKAEAAPPKTETAKPVEAKAEAKAAKKAKDADS